MKITVHAGHAPDGGVGCGATGILKESTEARRITAALMNRLADAGIEARDVTVNENMSANEVLRKLVLRMNSNDYDLHVSIHLNSAEDRNANGAEAYIYATNGYTENIGRIFCKEMEKIGYRNRGVKDGSGLYVIRHSEDPCILFECGFVSSELDTGLYDSERIADAIFNAIAGSNSGYSQDFTLKKVYAVQIGAFQNKANAEKILEEAKREGYADAFIREVEL